MTCTEAYKEHIMYSFNGFCKVVIRYAAINAYKREQIQGETSGHDVQKPEDTIFIDGQECIKTDEWKSGDDVYVLGSSVEDSDFFYAEVNGNTRFEYDHKPDRAEIEDDFMRQTVGKYRKGYTAIGLCKDSVQF